MSKVLAREPDGPASRWRILTLLGSKLIRHAKVCTTLLQARRDLTNRCSGRATRRAADSASPVQCLVFVRTGVAGPQLSSTVRPQITHRAVATSIVAFCLATFVSTIIGAALFGTHTIDLLAPVVLLAALRVAQGGIGAVKLSILFMALYVLLAAVFIGVALVAPSVLFARAPANAPRSPLLVIGGSMAVGTWCGFNLLALVRLLRGPVLAV